MSVWVVRELAAIEELIEQAKTRSLALSMRLLGTARGIEESAQPSARVPGKVEIDTERYTTTAGDAAAVHDFLAEGQHLAARAVKRAADLIQERE